jgi:Flp pilus assembly protein TadG
MKFSLHGTWRARLRKTLARMRAEENKASAAIEFGMIAPVFFIILMGIIETGVLYMASFTLQNATYDVARFVRTGQAQAGAYSQAMFRQKICDDIAVMLKCDANLRIDVEAPVNGYAGASFAPATDANGNIDPAVVNNYNIGSACSVVLIRTFYSWHIFTPILSPLLSNMSGGYHLLSATAAFRNEPFDNGIGGC